MTEGDGRKPVAFVRQDHETGTDVEEWCDADEWDAESVGGDVPGGEDEDAKRWDREYLCSVRSPKKHLVDRQTKHIVDAGFQIVRLDVLPFDVAVNMLVPYMAYRRARVWHDDEERLFVFQFWCNVPVDDDIESGDVVDRGTVFMEFHRGVEDVTLHVRELRSPKFAVSTVTPRYVEMVKLLFARAKDKVIKRMEAKMRIGSFWEMM